MKYTRKRCVMLYCRSNGSKVICLYGVAAILAAILDFSVGSRIHACYPMDIQYRGLNDVKSIIKTLTFHAGYGVNINFGTLTKWCVSEYNQRIWNSHSV